MRGAGRRVFLHLLVFWTVFDATFSSLEVMAGRARLHTIAETHEVEIREMRQLKPLLGSNPGPCLGAAYFPSPGDRESQINFEGIEPDPFYDVPLC